MNGRVNSHTGNKFTILSAISSERLNDGYSEIQDAGVYVKISGQDEKNIKRKFYQPEILAARTMGENLYIDGKWTHESVLMVPYRYEMKNGMTITYSLLVAGTEIDLYHLIKAMFRVPGKK